MLYVGLNGGRSELTEIEEFRFEGPRGDSRPLGSERPGKLWSSGDETDPPVTSAPFWNGWSPAPFGWSDGRECKGLSKCELEAARPLCRNESTGTEGGSVPDLSGSPCGEGDTSFWKASRNGDWRRGESRPWPSEAYPVEPERLELIEATEDLLCEGSIKAEGSKAIAGFIDCRLAARDVGGCKEPFKPLADALAESFINTCRGRTPSSRLVRRPVSPGRGTVSPGDRKDDGVFADGGADSDSERAWRDIDWGNGGTIGSGVGSPPPDCDRCRGGDPIGREPEGLGTGSSGERSGGEAGFRGRLRGLLKAPLLCGVLTELLGSKGCLRGVVGRSAGTEFRVLDFDRNELYASELPEGCCGF